MSDKPSAAPSESRARFEKFALAYFDIIQESFLRPDGKEYAYPGLRDGWQIWQAAERDIREQCAGEIEELWRHPQAKWLAERVRGKGAQ